MSSITHEKQKRPSLFGPIVLIAIGLFFLFTRLNPATDLYWVDVLRLWPLFLIFIGLNILVQQAPRPYGMLLSGFVALVAIGVFGYVLVAGLPSGLLGKTDSSNWETREISLGVAGVNSAVMDIEIGPPGADMFALEDSTELIAGTVTYQNEILFEKSGGDQVAVTLAPRNRGVWFWNPGQWENVGEADRWQLGLNPNVPLSLNLTANAGTSELDLSQLLLSDLELDVSAGEMTLFLPDGSYDVTFSMNAGSTTLTLPQSGRQTIDLEVNAGSVTIELPEGMALRVEVDQSLGSFNTHRSGLSRVGNSDVWQTPGYETSSNRVDMMLHISVGSVDVR